MYITIAEDFNILYPRVSDISNCHEVSTIYNVPSTLHVTIDVREVCVFLVPLFSSLNAIMTYLLTSEFFSVSVGLTTAGMIVHSYTSRSVAGSYYNTGEFIVKKRQKLQGTFRARLNDTLVVDVSKFVTKTDYMWVVSLFPNLHGREYEDICSIQCSVRSADTPSKAIVIIRTFQLSKQLRATQCKLK